MLSLTKQQKNEILKDSVNSNLQFHFSSTMLQGLKFTIHFPLQNYVKCFFLTPKYGFSQR